MDIVKSRNGYYTVTFTNKNNLDDQEIMKEFSTVGKVCKIVKNFHRVFIRFQEKEEAERALKKFGKIYDVNMAKNSVKASDNQLSDGSNTNSNVQELTNQTSGVSSEDSQNASLEELDPNFTPYHLILAYLPQHYTVTDVKALVEEANPLFINPIEETRVFNIRFCHIVLKTAKNLSYLIEKLNGFVISGEKLSAMEVKDLLEWKKKAT